MPVNWGLLRTASGALDIAIRAPGGESQSTLSLGRQVNSARQLVVGSTPSRVINGIGLTSDGCVCITATEPATKRYSSGIATDTSGRIWATESPVAPLRSIYDPLLEFVLVDNAGALYVDGLPPTSADILALTPIAYYQYGVGITSAGGLVSAWADQSGNANNLVQATGTNQPALQADNSILFDGNDNFLMTSGFTLNQPETVYVLMSQLSWTANDAFWAGLGAGSTGSTLRQTGSSPNFDIADGGASSTDNTGWALNTYAVITAQVNGSSSFTMVNNTTTSGSANITANMGGFILGARSNGAIGFAHMEAKEAIIFPVAHDAAQRATVIQYLSFIGA